MACNSVDTTLDDIRTARKAAARNLMELELAGPMKFGVNYSIDGRSFSWIEAKKYYADQVERLTDLMQKLQGPYTIKSRVI